MKQTRIIRTFEEMQGLTEFLLGLNMEKPWEFSWHPYKRDRSLEQNNLAMKWNQEIAQQLEDRTFENIRAYNKAHFAVPILRRDNEAFRAKYDEHIRPLPYETKLEIIELLDLPVTRLFNVKQMTEYLEAVSHHWRQQGVYLSAPEDMHERR